MANIRLNPDELRSRASEYTSQGKAMDEILKKMDTLLQALQTEWEGEASKAFADKYAKLKPGFVNTRDLVYNIGDALKKAATELEDRDKAIAGQINT